MSGVTGSVSWNAVSALSTIACAAVENKDVRIHEFSQRGATCWSPLLTHKQYGPQNQTLNGKSGERLSKETNAR